MNINLLLSVAKEKLGTKSDRALARAIPLASNNQIKRWREGHGLPSDGVVVRLCELAEFEPTSWLLELNAARCEPRSAAIYYKMYREYYEREAGREPSNAPRRERTA